MSVDLSADNKDVLDELPPITREYVREQPADAREVPSAPRVYKESRVRIILEEHDGIPPTGQFFGVQGEGFLLKPGKQADVPASIVDVLNNAVESKPVINAETQQIERFVDKLRFPYRVILHIPKGTVPPPVQPLR
jgi:hypothetical protein